jgi:hypothetical protein
VIAQVLGATVACLQADPDSSGESKIRPAGGAQTELTYGLAGLPAELRYCEMTRHCTLYETHRQSADDDYESAWAVALEAIPGDTEAAEALISEAEATAKTMVLEQWGRIERVALALFNSPGRTLSHGRLLELVDEGLNDLGGEESGGGQPKAKASRVSGEDDDRDVER